MSNEVNEQILEELRKIRETVEPKSPAPAPPAPKGFKKEFMAFLNKYVASLGLLSRSLSGERLEP